MQRLFDSRNPTDLLLFTDRIDVYICEWRYMTLDLFTLGETLSCLTVNGRFQTARQLQKSIGGSESNTAIGLARLGHAVAWASRLGEDPPGDEIFRTLRGEGVDVSAVRRSADAPTGLMIKERRGPSDIHVYYYRANSAASRLFSGDVPEAMVASARRVHLTGITCALGSEPAAAVHRIVSICQDRDIPVSFDLNLRRKLWKDAEAVAAYERLYPYVDDLLATQSELLICTNTGDLDDAAEYLYSRGVTRVVARRGPGGATGFEEGQRFDLQAESPVDVVDTVGAGDAFNAGYIHGLLTEQTFERSLWTGNWVASRVVAHHGDYEGLPSLHEYTSRLEPTRSTTR